MRQIKAIAVLFALLPGIAAAQPATLPANSVYGRQATPSNGGPGQAIKFSVFFANAGVPAGPVSCSSHNWFNTLAANGVLGCAQPAPTDISGLGAGVATALGNNVNSAGGFVTSPVPYANMQAGTSDTVIGFWGATVASALAINNCAGSLTYSTSTHTFGCNNGAGSGTVTEQKNASSTGISLSGNCDNTSTNAASPCTTAVNLTSIANSLGSAVPITTSSFASGPSVAQGSSGVWDAHGTVTLEDSSAASLFACKLWDGTNIIHSAAAVSQGAAQPISISLSGTSVSNPPGNIRIDCTDTTAGNHGTIQSSVTGLGKDSTVTALRIQ